MTDKRISIRPQAAPSSVAERESEVSSQCSRIEKAIVRGQELLGILEKRLDPVLRLVPESVGEEAEQKQSSLMGERLANHARQVESIVIRLDSILNRLEL